MIRVSENDPQPEEAIVLVLSQGEEAILHPHCQYLAPTLIAVQQTQRKPDPVFTAKLRHLVAATEVKMHR